MFTEELYIMDRNMERLMVSELQDEVNELKTTIQAERDVFKLRLKGKTSEEIAEELSVSIARVNEILGESNQGNPN